MSHELTPEQDRALTVAYHDAECSCRDDVSTYPEVPGPLCAVVARLLADERERVLRDAAQAFLAEHSAWGPLRPVAVRRWLMHRADNLGGRHDH